MSLRAPLETCFVQRGSEFRRRQAKSRACLPAGRRIAGVLQLRFGDGFGEIQSVHECEDSKFLITRRWVKEVSRGALNQEYSNGLVNPMIQPGSGSMDLQLQLQYAFRYEHWGLITTVQGKYDGKDASGYRIPHQMSVSAESFHQWGSDSTLHVLAKAGFLMDHSFAGSYIGPSEFGDMASQRQVLWTAGGEVYFRHLFVGLQAGFGRSSHQTEILQSGSSRMSLSAGFTF